jgi:hypothetical protein
MKKKEAPKKMEKAKGHEMKHDMMGKKEAMKGKEKKMKMKKGCY